MSLPDVSLGKKLISYMKSKGWRVRAINIVYLEDASADTWEPSKGELDAWDDVRILIRDTGEIIMSAEATVEPGLYYTQNRLVDEGVFRIDNGKQFKDAWVLGAHKNQYPCLIQAQAITGTRDGNEDGVRTGDEHVEGVFAINQHTTGNDASAEPPSKIGRWSAGCLVGRYAITHYRLFMPTLIGSGMRTFDTAIIAGDDFRAYGK